MNASLILCSISISNNSLDINAILMNGLNELGRNGKGYDSTGNLDKNSVCTKTVVYDVY